MANDLLLLPPQTKAPADYLWGTVTSASPLVVRLDGDTGVTPVSEDMSGPRDVGERVYCQLQSRRLVVLGPVGGTPSGDAAGNAGKVVRWSVPTKPEVPSTIGVPDPYHPTHAANKQYVDKIHRATVLGSNVNLDSLIEPGAYLQPANANTSTALNYPEASAGLCEVFGDGTSAQMRWQRYSVYRRATPPGPHSAIYQRSFYSSVWSPWTIIYEPPVSLTSASALGVTLSSAATAFTPSVVAENGVLTGQLAFTVAAARSAGTTGGLTLGTIAETYRPLAHAPMFWERGVLGYINSSSGAMVLDLNVVALSAGATVSFKTTYRYR